MSTIERVILTAIVAALIASAVALFNAVMAPTIAIRKDAWTCTAEESKAPIPVLIGKVMVMAPQGQQCVQWTKNK